MGGSDSFAWDYENRMTSATVAGVTTTFAYRGDGLRNSRTVGGNTTTFTWDVAGGLPTVIDDGAQYLYGPSGPLVQKQGSSKYYYLSDGLGSVMKTTDLSGAVVNAYTCDVYGKKTISSGSQANEFDFAGQQSDASTGLQYLRARYMDNRTGTFMSRDPLAAMPGYQPGTADWGSGECIAANVDGFLDTAEWMAAAVTKGFSLLGKIYTGFRQGFDGALVPNDPYTACGAEFVPFDPHPYFVPSVLVFG